MNRKRVEKTKFPLRVGGMNTTSSNQSVIDQATTFNQYLSKSVILLPTIEGGQPVEAVVRSYDHLGVSVELAQASGAQAPTVRSATAGNTAQGTKVISSFYPWSAISKIDLIDTAKRNVA